MVKMAKRIAQALSLFTFLLLLLVGIFSLDKFSFAQLPLIVLKAFTGYVIFWLLGIVISDIILKAVLTSMEDKKYDAWEGGLLVKFSSEKNEELQKANVRPPENGR
jgi:hypothetical protein